jgi:hypothetical protein
MATQKTVNLLTQEKARAQQAQAKETAARREGPRALHDTSTCPVCGTPMVKARVGMRGKDDHEGYVCTKDRIALPVKDRDVQVSAKVMKLGDSR